MTGKEPVTARNPALAIEDLYRICGDLARQLTRIGEASIVAAERLNRLEREIARGPDPRLWAGDAHDPPH